LYKQKIINSLKEIVTNGIPYLGTSAGSNICGLNMSTTNDMPIIYPPSFSTLGYIPFNINPHYLDPDPTSTHKEKQEKHVLKSFINSTPFLLLDYEKEVGYL
jgi:dipeptidase E